MSKIKRNGPCTCGSGKKYKKCCGAPNAIQISPKLINNELNRLHEELISFAINNYDKQIKEHTELHYKSLLQENDETVEVYNTGLTIWIILNVPILDNNQTIFDVFYNNNKVAVSQKTVDIFANWKNKTPSVYEVLSVDHQMKHFVTIKEIETNESYQFPINGEDVFVEGSLIIGTLVPFINYHNFLFTMIKLYQHDKSTLTQLMQQYSSKTGGLSKYFPDFLSDTLLLGIDSNKLDNPIQEMVAQEFANHMVNKSVDDDVILKGVTLWNQYCKKENPSFKKHEPYAAALEYLVQRSFLDETNLTQNQLAKEYGTSPGSVSTNFRKLSIAMTEVTG